MRCALRTSSGATPATVLDVMNRKFLGWTAVSDEARRHLYDIARHLVGKDHFPPDVFTGLVIAGFGDEEHFPVVHHMEVGGMYNDRLKVRPGTLHEVSDDAPSEVLAFAYQDMVDGFLDGISPEVFDHLGDAAAFIREMPVRALDGVAGIAPEAKAKATEIIRRESKRKAAEFARNVLRGAEARRGQIDQAVEALSLKELAQVASTLVGLSSFEHQMSLDRGNRRRPCGRRGDLEGRRLHLDGPQALLPARSQQAFLPQLFRYGGAGSRRRSGGGRRGGEVGWRLSATGIGGRGG